ncbi:MAG: glutamate racemase [Candidatus Zophobacter franzmannii]|nr:glutamate racemase [Candidatus Zophobacter franzmannii]
MKTSNNPIGIFDSGIGGLTVFKTIRKAFPAEDIVYFGDTARVPYGPKSKNTVIEYSIQNASFLIQQNAKIIIVACNTSSAVALPYIREITDIPVIGVIVPGAIAASNATRNNRIGIIGTEGTIRSEAYTKEILALKESADIHSTPCPLFVSLAEEGWENSQEAETIAETYLKQLLAEKVDTIVLGCTHYPILKSTIQKVVGKDVRLVDSSEAIIDSLRMILPNPEADKIGHDYFFVSDNEEKFYNLASRILNKEIYSLQKVRLRETWFVEKSD